MERGPGQHGFFVTNMGGAGGSRHPYICMTSLKYSPLTSLDELVQCGLIEEKYFFFRLLFLFIISEFLPLAFLLLVSQTTK